MKSLSVILHVITLVALGFSSYFWSQTTTLLNEKQIGLQSLKQVQNDLLEDIKTQTITNTRLRDNLITHQRSQSRFEVKLNEAKLQSASAIQEIGEKNQEIELLQTKLGTLEGKHRVLQEDHSKSLSTKQSERAILSEQLRKQENALALQKKVLEARNRELEIRIQRFEVELARIKHLSSIQLKKEAQKQLSINGDQRPDVKMPQRK